jgi:hypothetical protein
VSLADDFALDADELEDVIGCWWSQTESNRRPLQCHCHGPTFLKTSTRRLSLPKPFEFAVFGLSSLPVISRLHFLVATWWRF